MELRHLGGALTRVAPHAGALATLDGAFALFAAGVGPTPEAVAGVEAALVPVFDAVRPWDTGRRYLNFAESRRTDPAALFPPAVGRRLAAVKADVDPDGLFQANHPLDPAR